MMKTCFIFPGITEVGFNSFGNPAFGFLAHLIHHGLCSLSASVKQAGYPAELIDLRKMRGWGHFRKELKSRNPDVVAATMMSPEYDIVLNCLRIAKELNPQVITVVGGIHATVATEEVERQKDIDYIMLGEGEISFVELLRSLEAGEPCERVITGERPDLDQLPLEDRELFDVKAELNHPLHARGIGFEPPFVSIITARGCKYNCRFCQPGEKMLFGRKVRQRSVENVMAELKHLRDRYNFKSFLIHDDAFTQDVEWVREFCRQYRANGFTQLFWAQSRVDFLCKEEEVVAELSQTGLRALSIGFESGNDRVLRFLRKGTKVEQNYRAAEVCRKYGIKIQANFMFGIPTETRDEVMDTVGMIRHIKPEFPSLFIFSPFPGDDLSEYCRQNNLILVDRHASYSAKEFTPKIRGVDYHFIAHAIEEALGLSWRQKIIHRLRRISLIEQTLRTLVKHEPFKGLLLWWRR